MLDPAEAAEIAERFGVSDEQVRRDHLISHLLAALARQISDSVVFFVGTALARTHLPDGRLSEDIDLYARPTRLEVVADVEAALATGTLREYGRLTWEPPLSAVRDTVPAALRTQDGLSVRVRLLDSASHPGWPTERCDLHQRYSDAPPAMLTVPTLCRPSQRRRRWPGRTGTRRVTSTTCGVWPSSAHWTRPRQTCLPN